MDWEPGRFKYRKWDLMDCRETSDEMEGLVCGEYGLSQDHWTMEWRLFSLPLGLAFGVFPCFEWANWFACEIDQIPEGWVDRQTGELNPWVSIIFRECGGGSGNPNGIKFGHDANQIAKDFSAPWN